jgi:uncharacterized protein YecE (DUF72 family)
MKKAATIYSVGIGGWEHDVFDQCFYPEKQMDSMQKLSCYSRVFDTVEVRATFWDDALKEEDAKKWIQAVRENRWFTFNVKLHSSFTHKKMIRPAMTRNVRSVLHELLKADRLGTLLMQFPYSFTNTSANRYHLVRLAEVFAGYPVRIEFRHDSWNQASTWDLLQEHSLALVNADFPHVRQFMPYSPMVIQDHSYLRLHGRNEKGWLLNGLDARYDYLYNERELREIERRLDVLSRKCTHVTIIFNNTTGGKAIANALQLVSSIRDGKHVVVPEATLRAFPHLNDIAAVVDAKQVTLLDVGYRQAM